MNSTCQIMLSNHTQCQNSAWATENGVNYCRLHFSYMLAGVIDVSTLVNPQTVNENDKPDLENMLIHKVEAQKKAQEILEGAKLV